MTRIILEPESVVPEHKSPRPRRTREHIIAAQSVNYLEKSFIDKGHTVDRPAEDYGFDLLINTFDEEGYPEGGDIRIQLRASDDPRYSADRAFVSLTITIKHYDFWMSQPMPVFLVLYDAREEKGYWSYIQQYFAADAARGPRPRSKTVTVRIPTVNEFTQATVDYARDRKATILSQVVGDILHEG